MRRLLSRISLCFVLFGAALLGPNNAAAQSFLERLEQAVKKQLVEPTPTEASNPQASSQELPPPKVGGNPSGNSAVRTPPPRPTPPRTETSQSPRGGKGGRIFLGLEGEDPIGAGIGVRVSGVTKNSPAWKAGFVVGDRILAINGFAVARLNDMVEQLGKTRPGDTVRFLVSRAGRNIKLAAVLMAADLAEQTIVEESTTARTGTPFVGVTVNDLTSSFRKQFGISVFTGAAVSGVAKGSPAESAGIQAGDAIIEFNSAPIESARDLREQVSQLVPGQKVEVIYYRGGFGKQTDFVVGNLLGTLPSGRNSSGSKTLRVPLTEAQPRVETPASSLVVPANPGPVTVPTPGVSTLPSILESDVAAQPKGVTPGTGLLSLNPSSNPSSNRSQEIDPAAVDALAKQVFELESENSRLVNELKATRDELAKTREKLDQILNLLKQR